MIKSVSKLSLFIIIIISTGVVHGNFYTKYDEMVNAFILGLDEKGLNIGQEIISLDEHKSIREKSLFFLAEYFFSMAISSEDEIYGLQTSKRSHKLYSMFQTDYPDSDYSDIIEQRLFLLTNFYNSLNLYGELYSDFNTKALAVQRLYDIGNIYDNVETSNVYDLVKLYKGTNSKIKVAHKYYDELIINHPEFEIIGYYLKIMSFLDDTDKWDSGKYYKDSINDDNPPSIKPIVRAKIEKHVSKMIDYLDQHYPSHPYTLDIHLAYAMKKDNFPGVGISKKEIKKLILKDLEHIVTHDKDKTGLRYIFAKEYIIKNF
jgi:hypothetical protein